MTAPDLRTVQIQGPWERLHRAESEALARLLTAAEAEAVNRRLGLPAVANPGGIWIPASSGPMGGRFAAPHGPGVLYLGDDLATCIAEVAFHHALMCAASVGTPPGTRATFRRLRFEAQGTFADAARDRAGGLHDPANYGPSWGFGHRVRAAGLWGVHYRSVRRAHGRCLAVFDPGAATCSGMETGAVLLEWDGAVSAQPFSR